MCPPGRRNQEHPHEIWRPGATCTPLLALYPFWPGAWVHLKTWKTGRLQDQLAPKWNSPHSVILIPQSALKLQGAFCGYNYTLVTRPPSQPVQPGTKDSLDYRREPLSDLKRLFQKTAKCDQGYSGHSSEPRHQGTLAYKPKT